MEYNDKVKAAVPAEMEAVHSKRLHLSKPMCNAVPGNCKTCPWDIYDAGCARVAGMTDDDERALACCFMAAIAELGTDE
jgi:hypothetical protein